MQGEVAGSSSLALAPAAPPAHTRTRRSWLRLPSAARACGLAAALAAFAATSGLSDTAWATPAARPSASQHTPRALRASGRPSARAGGALAPPVTARRARVDGPFGVLEESASPIIDTRTETGEEDPLLKALVGAVQAADTKRGVDISAFWINNGWDIAVIITALSRPQLQAIAQQIEYTMRKKIRIKRRIIDKKGGQAIRDEASGGWVCMIYNRLTINIMTPVQRTYYDIESAWRDDNQDYEKIPLDVLLREEGFGNMRLTRELGGVPAEGDDEEGGGDDVAGGVEDDDLDYEEDEDDPFWS